MNRWKTIAMMSLGFTCGVVWTAACGGADSAKADDSGYEDDGAGGGSAGSGGGTPPPSAHGGARTVLKLYYGPDGGRCYYSTEDEGPNPAYEVDCCPSGFSYVGTQDGASICLQDAS